jgi:N-acetylmuramoyl-L-alanine amidase
MGERLTAGSAMRQGRCGPFTAMIERPSPNFEPRRDGASVDMLIIHYTGMRDAKSALDRLCDPDAKVSAHYLIDEDGTVVRMVAEEMRAWHAGVSSWRGETDVNGRSIGIELVNPGHEFGYRPFPEGQMRALESLAAEIVARHSIPPRHVLGHSDVAPARKMDPGELFDWARLASAGVGLWPAADASAGHRASLDGAGMLTAFGYGIGETPDSLKVAVEAFQRHYRPSRIDGVLDEDTLGRLGALCRQCP